MKVGDFFDKLAGAEVDTPLAPAQTGTPKQPRQNVVKLPSLSITGVVFFVVVIGASFFLGAMYEKSHQPTAQTLGSNGSSGNAPSTTQPQPGSNGFGRFGGGGYGQFNRSSISTATVSAISSTSITTQDSSGNTSTYTISSNTVITDGSTGQQDTTNNISTGDTVIVIPDRTNMTTARRIIVNPQVPSTQPTTVNPGTSQLD
jgi:hypothetical protein